MNAAAYIKEHNAELDYNKFAVDKTMPYSPPTVIEITPSRMWLNPNVTDFKLSSRAIKRSEVPGTSLPEFLTYYTRAEMLAFGGAPLSIIGLEGIASAGTNHTANISGASPLTVMEHPSSRSHIARTTVNRLEKDIENYAEDANASMNPTLLLTSDCDLTDTRQVGAAINKTQDLISKLVALRNRDTAFSRNGIKQVVNFCNGRTQKGALNVQTLGHVAHQMAYVEATLVRAHFLYVFMCYIIIPFLLLRSYRVLNLYVLVLLPVMDLEI